MYDAVTNSFNHFTESFFELIWSKAAVNRDGSLVATQLYDRVSLDTADLQFRHSFAGLDSGVAFDATRDILYGVNSTTDEIIAYRFNNVCRKITVSDR